MAVFDDSMMYLHHNRCVLLKHNNRQAWDTLCDLMDHNQERFAKDQDAVAMFSLITNFFLDELKLDFVTKEEIEHMIGVLLTNGFENDHEDVPGRSIYPTLSLCSHSCRANLRHAVNPGHQVALQVRTNPFILRRNNL